MLRTQLTIPVLKYYVNGATAYLLYDKDYFYVYVEADEGENVTYFTLGNPDKTDTVGPFWSHTASVKFDFNAKNVTTKGWEYGVFNQNGQSTFADNISVERRRYLPCKGRNRLCIC